MGKFYTLKQSPDFGDKSKTIQTGQDHLKTNSTVVFFLFRYLLRSFPSTANVFGWVGGWGSILSNFIWIIGIFYIDKLYQSFLSCVECSCTNVHVQMYSSNIWENYERRSTRISEMEVSFCCQVFKKLFRDGLDIQKERIRELRRYAREQRQRRAEKHHTDLVSLEN